VRDLSVSCSTAAWVHGDETRLHQVVSNLLSNAVKYTRHGGQIAVHVESRSAGDVTLTVRDDGIGIAAADLPHVFDLFSQIRDPLQASVGGLGIGLAVVRRLVELHGGTITAASPGPGNGAEFKVRLPLVEAPALKGAAIVQPTSGLDEDSSGARRRVLVVDDNIDAADSLSVLLRAQGFTVQVAHDGRGALSAADEFRPDVAVLDLGLPDLPGEEVGVAMRSRPWGRNVQLVAVTGWGQPKDRARTAAAGFEHHLVKPVEPAELIEVLNAPRVVASESASA
jgi:CheY-like chemotaxis protein